MDLHSISESIPEHEEPRSSRTRSAASPRGRDHGDTLVVAEAATPGWCRVGEEVRVRVAAALSPRAARQACDTDQRLPAAFAQDIASGCALLRTALPVLTLHVIAVHDDKGAIQIRMRCEGEQHGPFFGIIAATGRRVQFDVVHRIDVADGRVTQHRIEVDFRCVVRQLGVPKRGCSS